MTENRYFATGSEFASERARLSLLEANCDPTTFERLARVGVAPGWRCLEVAAGGGSVACWLANRVGLQGSVTATDLDTRFLAALDLPKNVAVRRHDIDSDPLEPETYDLVHSRALVEHLPDPGRALGRMAAALRPGGWLVVEAADFTALRSAWPEHASSAVFDRVARAFVDAMLVDGIMDLLMAPRLPLLLEQLGLVQVDNDGVARIHRGGTPRSRFLSQSVGRVRERLLERGRLGERDLAAFERALEDPSFEWVGWIGFAAWGRRASLAA